jgi:hypothetical protein
MPAWLVKSVLVGWCLFLSCCVFYGATAFLTGLGLNAELAAVLGGIAFSTNIVMLDTSNPIRRLDS